MIVLDTDHFSPLVFPDSVGHAFLSVRMKVENWLK
jgi:hypothetical protein